MHSDRADHPRPTHRRAIALLGAVLAVLVAAAPGAAFDSTALTVPSAVMHTDIPTQVLLPAGYADGTTRFPVVYLMHGAGDHEYTCLNATSIKELADRYHVIVVCAYAGMSWYFDSPEDPASQYETFIAKELVAFVDGHYRTISDRKHRATLGSSMGGHGALFLAIRHRDTFAIAASMSGGVDFRAFPDNWNLPKVLGVEAQHQDRWDELTVLNQAKKLKDGDLAISFECGVNDFFLPCNRALHQELLDQKVAHDYTERPGYHGWDYWPNAITYQMLFISQQFQLADQKK